jgi:hypothetical protein
MKCPLCGAPSDVEQTKSIDGVPIRRRICHKGRFIAVEAKAGSNKPTALQELHLARIRAAGGIALVINETNMDTLQKELT